MPQDIGLDSTQRAAYHDGMRLPHPIRNSISILDQNEDEIGALTTAMEGDVEDGQVDVDARAPISRQAILQVYDPENNLHLEPNNPATKSLFPDRFLRIVRMDFIKALADQDFPPANPGWVRCPVFHGPLATFDRSQDLVTLSGVGKEALLMPPNVVYRPFRVYKGAKVTVAIGNIAKQFGESRLDLSSVIDRKLPATEFLPRGTIPWVVINQLAELIEREPFYDGRGRLFLQVDRESPNFTFHQGENGEITSTPIRTYDWNDMYNAVTVIGRKPKKKGARRPVARKVAGRGHPLSPWSLARNGKPQYRWLLSENHRIRSSKAARKMARRLLDRGLRIALGAQFECTPVPDLLERECVGVEIMPGRFITTLMSRWTIPLKASKMPVGFHRMLTLSGWQD